MNETDIEKNMLGGKPFRKKYQLTAVGPRQVLESLLFLE